MIPQPTTRNATPSDATPFVAAMSDFDRGNLATAFADPAAAVEMCIARSAHTFYAEAETPLFLGGMFPGGAVWMISTPAVAQHRKFYLRETRRQRDIMTAMAPRLHCSVDVRYPKSLRWLEWLGFTVGDMDDLGGVAVRKAELMRNV